MRAAATSDVPPSPLDPPRIQLIPATDIKLFLGGILVFHSFDVYIISQSNLVGESDRGKKGDDIPVVNSISPRLDYRFFSIVSQTRVDPERLIGYFSLFLTVLIISHDNQ